MNILIVDDLMADVIKFDIVPVLREIKLYSQWEIYIAKDPKSAEEQFANNDIDIAIVDIKLQSTINGFQLPFVKSNYHKLKRSLVILFLSSHFDEISEGVIDLIHGYSKDKFFESKTLIDNFFSNALSQLIELGKLIKLNFNNQDTYFKVNNILFIIYLDKGVYLYFNNGENRILLAETSIASIASNLKGDKLVMIKQSTIVNLDHYNESSYIENPLFLNQIGITKEILLDKFSISRNLRKAIKK